MLFPTAGSRFYIADAPTESAGALPVSGWVEIAETEALGILGVEWGTESADIMESCDADQHATEVVAKSVLRRPPMPVILGLDVTDPGQMILRRAALSIDAYPFRLVFPDGVTTRGWFALVLSLSEVFDTANGVMKLQADLKPISTIIRSEAP